jgi:hypothetical protein
MYRARFQYSTVDSFFYRALEGETSADCLLPLKRFRGLYWSSLYDRSASMICLLASQYPERRIASNGPRAWRDQSPRHATAGSSLPGNRLGPD